MTLPLYVILVIVLLSGCSKSTDQIVVSTVLRDFTSRSDINLFSTGVTLISPETETWSAAKYQFFNFDAHRHTCNVTQELLEELLSQNARSESTGWFVQSNHRWRVETPKEVDSLDYGVPGHLPSGEVVKTLASLTQPVYSEDGGSALVLLHFTWSIHDAVAHYVVARSGPGWSVECSQFRFYV